MVDGFSDNFENEEHTQDEFDAYEKQKLKEGKAGKVTDYKTYKKSLRMRNLIFNFKSNTKGLASAVAPVLKKMGENAAANADNLMAESTPTLKPKTAKKKG